MPVEKSRFPLTRIQKALQLTVILHLADGMVDQSGDEEIASALLKSNFRVVLQSNLAMPIRLAHKDVHEIYEMVILNQRGFVAKEGRINRYLVVLALDKENVLAAIGDDLDPGMVLFEIMQYV
ncbi:MAG: hypothetical protein ACFFE8_14800 [Candidatus Heimdallarchaeota archaeon]